jgi:hypothetical protein
MSERIGLGAADADSRWIGVRRHQAVLVIAGSGLTGDWLVRANGSYAELIAGAVVLACAVPTTDGLTVGEFVMVGVRYVARSRWTHVTVDTQSSTVRLSARGRVAVRGFELQHRGRLDLCGFDVAGANDLAVVADAMATSERTGHVSLHVTSTTGAARTLLTLSDDVAPPDGWAPNGALVLDVAGLATRGSMWMFERWRYLRTSSEVVRVLRVGDYSAVAEGRALLERLQQSGPGVSVGLHFDVVSGSRARRIAERAVHQTGSDGAVSRAAGFRRTSRAERFLGRLGQREALVASGRALLRVAVYVTVRAGSADQLRQSSHELIRRAHEAGLRCERGFGRQARWYCHQLPGGPGW